MALNVGEHFKQRWLATPEAVRQAFCDELNHICELLEPDIQIQKWQYQDALLQQKHRHIIERAYEKLKQDIIAEQARQAEQRKRQRQAELEQALAAKRAEEEARLAELEALEQQKQLEQNTYLQEFAQELQQQAIQQSHTSIARFDVSQARQFNQNSSMTTQPAQFSPQNEDLKTRLEIEAEYYIEQTLQQLREKLQAAAREEIELILVQQNHTS